MYLELYIQSWIKFLVVFSFLYACSFILVYLFICRLCISARGIDVCPLFLH
jgi:hypothetical protein